eukprot:UN4424
MNCHPCSTEIHMRQRRSTLRCQLIANHHQIIAHEWPTLGWTRFVALHPGSTGKHCRAHVNYDVGPCCAHRGHMHTIDIAMSRNHGPMVPSCGVNTMKQFFTFTLCTLTINSILTSK